MLLLKDKRRIAALGFDVWQLNRIFGDAVHDLDELKELLRHIQGKGPREHVATND